MEITYLGHAGFCVETKSSIVIMDPWFSSDGAFDAAWFQFPQNHHMAEFVQAKLNSNKDKYIYISHEHKDHFDVKFLMSIKNRDFTLLLANFEHKVIAETLQKHNFVCKEIKHLAGGDEFKLKDANLIVFELDTEFDCDSAILIRSEGKNFLNLNDCKIFERLGDIVKKWGKIDIFTAQFSGAVWHPTCYKMPKEKYDVICKKKIQGKFDTIAKAITFLEPSLYLPSAGPPCFLDPMLLEINFQEINIYPRAPQLLHFLDQHFADKNIKTKWPEIMPGDVLDANTMKFTYLSPERVTEENTKEYIKVYAARYKEFFANRERENSKANPKETFVNLRTELLNKVKHFKAEHNNIPTPLYWQVREYPDEMYKVDFKNNIVKAVAGIEDQNNYYYISAPAWQIDKVLRHEISWPDFALTFRVTLDRNPDVYNTLIDGFLTLGADRIKRFCELFSAINARKERITVEYKGKKYSVLRYCPHQGGDLLYAETEGCLLVCPRHHWAFDLENKGICRYNDATIDAICLDDDAEADNNISPSED